MRLLLIESKPPIGSEINMVETDIVPSLEEARRAALRQAMNNQNMNDWAQSWSDSDSELKRMGEAVCK